MGENTEAQRAPICFVDTETTSLRADREAWEIALILVTPDGDALRYRECVEVTLANADPASLKFSRFYDRHPQGREAKGILDGSRPVDGESVALNVAAFTHGAHLVGVNPAFDALTLESLLTKHNLVPAWHYHVIDLSAMALGWLNCSYRSLFESTRDPRFQNPIVPPYESDELSRLCGVEPPSAEDRHTAMGDAEWAKRWYDRLSSGRGA